MARLLALPAALIALILSCGAARAATFRVGIGTGCTHATIQSAINDAAADPDVADFIRVTRNQIYSDIALDIHDQHLVVVGGYVNCLDEVGDGQRTVLAGDGDNSVVRIHGSGDVVLRYLTLSGGHEPPFDYGYGGGVQIYGGPHLVSLDHMLITNNEAGHGGGISLRNDVSGDPNQNRLMLGDDVVVSFNHAEYPIGAYSGVQGGGIYCFESSLQMIGGGSTSITANTASLDGGGIGAIECDITIAPHGTYGSFNGVVLNEAGRDGGGLAIEGPSGGGTRLYVTDPSRPVYVSGNSAGREGGAIKVNTNATVDGWDPIIDGNRSFGEGGAVSVFHGAANGTASFRLHGGLGDAPSGAVRCNPDRHCNSISSNIAMNSSSEPQVAAALRVRADPAYPHIGAAEARLDGTHLLDNTGRSLVRVYEPPDFLDAGDASVELNGTLMAGNDVSEDVLRTGESSTNFHGGEALVVIASTIAGNAIGGEVIRSHTNIGLLSNILWQPGVRAIDAGSGSLDADRVLYLLASDLTGIPVSPTLLVADPRFMDVERGDFHLHASSPAIDFAPSGPASEGDGLPRSVNLTLVPDDGFGPQDLGSYERQSIGNLVRNAEFDDDLHIWTDAAPDSTNWSDEDHAGSGASGSIEVADGSPTMRVLALRQCIGIPGPGTYRLQGWGYVSADHSSADYPIIAWNYFPNSADCSGGADGSGENTVADTTTGWHPVSAQFIGVPAGGWTPNTSVEVQLFLQKGDDPLFPESGFTRFDAVALTVDSDVIFADGFDP